jgi:threonine dehydrogenase-like Zn-dependent dehydrogenase
MRALTIIPGKKGSAQLVEVPDPSVSDGPVVVQTLTVGVCGTDVEMVNGEYGMAPPGQERLIIGHESLGRVLEAPAGLGLVPGDLVVGIVRRPDPVPCLNCAVGEWDMCRNGLYTERGIKQRHGYGAERFRIEPEFAVKLDRALQTVGVLLEPASIVAKAWEHTERIGRRARWEPQTALVTGAGPIGLLAALLGVQRGLDVHVLDRATDGPKPTLVRDLGATYHTGSPGQAAEKAGGRFDVVIECTGAGEVIFDAIQTTGHGGIVCLTGLSTPGRQLKIDATAFTRDMVLENDVVFGSVNANQRHYQAAAAALKQADRAWLGRLITRRVSVERWAEALSRRPDDIKVVIDFTETQMAA